jgi:hypothetical protein
MKHSPFTIGRRTGNDAVVPVDSASGVSGAHLTLIFETPLLRHGREEHLRHHINGQSAATPRFCSRMGYDRVGPKVKLQFGSHQTMGMSTVGRRSHPCLHKISGLHFYQDRPGLPQRRTLPRPTAT